MWANNLPGTVARKILFLDKSMKGNKTILLTGGAGFLGSHLLKALIAGQYEIILLLRNSSDTSRIDNIAGDIKRYYLETTDLKQMIMAEKVDIILHCATNYGRKDVSPISILEANLILPLELLQFGSENKVACFINTDTILDKRVNQYSLSKSQFKEWLKLYAPAIKCINIALEHFYGPCDDETKFVTYIIRSILRNVDKIDLTKGGQKRDFIYIDDVVEAFMRIIDYHSSESSRQGFVHYEIGAGHSIEIRKFVELVKHIAENTCTHLNFGALPYRLNEAMDSRVDVSELKKLGWEARISLEEGIKRTISVERSGGKI